MSNRAKQSPALVFSQVTTDVEGQEAALLPLQARLGASATVLARLANRTRKGSYMGCWNAISILWTTEGSREQPLSSGS